uniref:Ig-like domain-containing protein n=2 Tax=Anabas testudineus TaxID=64144 RepID=A0A3Q1GVW7_ANATE
MFIDTRPVVPCFVISHTDNSGFSCCLNIKHQRNCTGRGNTHLHQTSAVFEFCCRNSQQLDNMEVTALCFRLVTLGVILLGHVHKSQTRKSDAVRLHVSPNRLQHFEYESVTFQCESTDGSTQLKGIRNTEEIIPACSSRKPSPRSLCAIDKVYSADSGQYWCETSNGQRSNSVNITVTGGPVILESPALVSQGEAVTLRCIKKTNSTNLPVFYKDDTPVQINAAEIRITNVSKSHEGFYKCSFSDVETSPGSWLLLRAKPVVSASSGHSTSVLILLWVAVVILLVILVLVLVGILLIRKHRVTDAVTVFSKIKRGASRSGGDNHTRDSSNEETESDDYSAVPKKPRLSHSRVSLNSTADKD